jgi:hypothetical protein
MGAEERRRIRCGGSGVTLAVEVVGLSVVTGVRREWVGVILSIRHKRCGASWRAPGLPGCPAPHEAERIL